MKNLTKVTQATLITLLLTMPVMADITIDSDGPSNSTLSVQEIRLFSNKAMSLEGFANKAERTLEKMGCDLDKAKTQCAFSLLPDPKKPNSDARIETDKPYCDIASLNCSEPIQGAWSESCPADTMEIKVPRSARMDRGFGYGVASSIFGYSRKVCIDK